MIFNDWKIISKEFLTAPNKIFYLQKRKPIGMDGEGAKTKLIKIIYGFNGTN